MNGERVVVDGTEWIEDIVEHWPPGGKEDGPTTYDVTFYDPEDREQWVSRFRIPAATADLSEEGLRKLFREAGERSWRDASGRIWRIRAVPSEPARPGERGARSAPGVLTFIRHDGTECQVFSRRVPDLSPLGHLTDETLEGLLKEARAATAP